MTKPRIPAGAVVRGTDKGYVHGDIPLTPGQQRPVEKFEETWHDDGKTNLLECMRAYRDVGFDGVLRPDHVPTVEGDNNERPGYSSFGRLYAIGYIRGLRDAVYASPN